MLRCICIIAALALVACASTDESLEPKPLQDFDAQVEVNKRWSTDIGSGQDVRYTLLVPAVSDDTVYATDINGDLFAIDRETGKRRWRTKLDEPVSAGVGLAGDTLLVGTYNAEVIALSTEDGSEKWRAKVSSEVLSPPQSNGRVVAVQTFDGKVTGLSSDTGETLWVYETKPPLLTLRGNAAPLVNGSMIYAGFATGKVVALQASDGLVEWDQRVAIPKGQGEFEKLVDIDGTPVLQSNILFVASYQGQLMALSQATGRPLWVKPISTYNNLAANSDTVFVTDAESSVKAFRIGNGQLKWENNELLRRKLTAPTAWSNFVAVADDEDGYLHILDEGSGTIVGRRKIDGDGVRSPLIADGDTLFVLSNGGKLMALSVDSL